MEPLLSLKYQQEPGNQADGNMYSYSVDHPAPVHLPQMKKKCLIFDFYSEKCKMFL